VRVVDEIAAELCYTLNLARAAFTSLV
jgi:hypothetical protein